MDFIRKAFEKNANNAFLVGHICVTYSEFLSKSVDQVPLDSKKIALLPLSDGFVALSLYLVCILQSVVPIMVPEKLSKSKLDKYIKSYKPDYIFTRFDIEESVDFVNYVKSEKNIFNQSFFFYCNEESKEKPIRNTALLLSTSGSTGDPKLVKLSETNLFSNTKAICNSLNLSISDTAILSLPLNYSFGLSVIHSHIMTGTKIVISDPSILAKSFWDDFIDYEVKCLYGVPYQFEMLKKLKVFSKISESFRFFAQAGGSMQEDLTKWFIDGSVENKTSIFIMYGQTECSPRVSCFDVTKNSDKLGSVGKAINDCLVTIKDNKPNGELLIKGKNVFTGYARSDKDLNSEKYSNTFHASGDIGYIDNEGFIFITGRAKRFVKIYGHNVNLDHLESNLRKIYKDIAVIGEDNKIKIFFTGNHHAKQIIQSEINLIKTINSRSLKIESINAIPRLENGKIDYLKLKTI